ncbi:GPR1/FUN34/YaaH family transporter [Asanoa sp. WMMD1127]|uniref:GPR1/FUN34/YaaH family transporter n=1 Tax=Asanoa sp. WMMD1127 TaxID=3016107 RepID=UPI0024172309|nr:GPR1/FUN34/YaaH family transporter [Asanoa sp. WMMD1127]MDG4820858.1 GPR1/FUN34/YaaH family transporter [Asanoa sp. WMMD1127]
MTTTAEPGPRDRLTIVLRPVGAPTSIGLFGLAGATLPLSGLQLGWIGADQGHQVALALIGFAFVAQLVAAVFSLLARDGTIGTAMATLALTWLVVGLVLVTSRPGATSPALGLFLLVSGSVMTLLALSAALGKLVPALVFLLAALRFFATASYELSGSVAWERTAGVIGVVLFAVAMYAAWAANLEDVRGRTVLPLGRHGKGRTALSGARSDQVADISTEPGVRQQL